MICYLFTRDGEGDIWKFASEKLAKASPLADSLAIPALGPWHLIERWAASDMPKLVLMTKNRRVIDAEYRSAVKLVDKTTGQKNKLLRYELANRIWEHLVAVAKTPPTNNDELRNQRDADMKKIGLSPNQEHVMTDEQEVSAENTKAPKSPKTPKSPKEPKPPKESKNTKGSSRKYGDTTVFQFDDVNPFKAGSGNAKKWEAVKAGGPKGQLMATVEAQEAKVDDRFFARCARRGYALIDNGAGFVSAKTEGKRKKTKSTDVNDAEETEADEADADEADADEADADETEADEDD